MSFTLPPRTPSESFGEYCASVVSGLIKADVTLVCASASMNEIKKKNKAVISGISKLYFIGKLFKAAVIPQQWQ
jgi:hypothetical protein